MPFIDPTATPGAGLVSVIPCLIRDVTAHDGMAGVTPRADYVPPGTHWVA